MLSCPLRAVNARSSGKLEFGCIQEPDPEMQWQQITMLSHRQDMPCVM